MQFTLNQPQSPHPPSLRILALICWEITVLHPVFCAKNIVGII